MSDRQTEQKHRRRERWLPLAAAGSAIVALAACSGGSSSSGTGSREGLLLLASTAHEATGETVDGIKCETAEQVLFHIHAHLAVYVGGRPRLIPEGIGIAPPRRVDQTTQGPFVVAGSCFYWLHSHTRDGIVHIESPIRRTFTLGNYFDIWRQPLSDHQVGPARGAVTAYRDGKRFTGDPRSLPLTAHALLQLDVGKPVPPAPFTFPPGL